MSATEPFEPSGNNLPTGPETSKEISGEAAPERLPASEFSKAQLLTNSGDALDGAQSRYFTPVAMLREKSVDLGNGLAIEIIGHYDSLGLLQSTAVIAEKTESDGSKTESYMAVAKSSDGLHVVDRKIYHRTPEEVKTGTLPNMGTDRAAALRINYRSALRKDPEGAPSAFELSGELSGETDKKYVKPLSAEDVAQIYDSLRQPAGSDAELSEDEAQAINRIIKEIDWKSVH
jgi:hypothetical protein